MIILGASIDQHVGTVLSAPWVNSTFKAQLYNLMHLVEPILLGMRGIGSDGKVS